MKKAAIVVAMVALLVMSFAGAALAATLTGTSGSDDIVGTKKADYIDGRSGMD